MKRVLAIIALAALVLCGCGGKAADSGAEQTTLTGIVVSIDGTVVQLMDSSAMGGDRGNRGEGGERPTMPEGETMPEGNFTFPEGEMPTMPEGMTPPEGFEGGNMPGFGGQRPEGAEGDFTVPEGEMPSMPEGAGGNRFNTEDMETTSVDLKDAHISLELEDGSKAAGSMSDITVGSRLTITMEGDKAVRVVVGQSSFGGFGGGNMPNFGGQGGNRGDRPNRENSTNQS